ncbi:MAG: AraC family ligand binding domain-containing protein, partial [Solobacterium sp.]|nr:AraC family ligand binding domain-containing protein [Solobacterium sp.]
MKKQYRSTFLTRQYMLSDDFEIFYYSDTHFNTVPMHSHDYYEFYVFVEGDVRFKIGKNIYPIKLGTLFIIPPGTNHQVIVNPNKTYSRFVFWISKEYCNSLLQQ